MDRKMPKKVPRGLKKVQFWKFLFTISSLDIILHLLYQGMVFSKIWRELGFVYYIEYFTISRFTISRLGCIPKSLVIFSVMCHKDQHFSVANGKFCNDKCRKTKKIFAPYKKLTFWYILSFSFFPQYFSCIVAVMQLSYL